MIKINNTTFSRSRKLEVTRRRKGKCRRPVDQFAHLFRPLSNEELEAVPMRLANLIDNIRAVS